MSVHAVSGSSLKLFSTILLSVFLVFGATSARSNSSGAVQYPIVLVHGLSGFDTLLFVDYFFGVENALASVGADEVFTAQVTAFESNEVRGEQLLSYVQDVLAVTGASKVNLIGHSQGGPTSRYVAAVRPDLVASVTSIGSPHYGSDVADLITNSPLSPAVSGIADALGGLIAALSGDPGQSQNAMAALASLDSAGSAVFNAAYPQGLRNGSCRTTPWVNVGRWWFPKWVKDYSVNDGDHVVNGVRYYSWGGTYNALTNSNALDPIDAVFALTSLVHGDDNDGLVERCSMHLGDNIRDDYTLNHLDQTNGLFGLRGLFTTSPLPLYKAHAARLKNAGL